MGATFGQRLREARKRAKLSGPDLARLLGVSARTVSEWERDKYRPSADKFIALARLTPVGVDWLLSGKGSEVSALGGGRLVPKVAFDDLGQFDPRSSDVSGSERVLSQFACGPQSFQIVVPDAANAPRFLSGDSVIIDPDLLPSPGDMVLVVVGQSAMFRKYRPRGKHVDLEPLNPDWEPVKVTLGKDAELLGTMSEHTQPRR